MKKTLIWVGVLVVVVVLVLVLRGSGGGKKGTAGKGHVDLLKLDRSELRFGQQLYTDLVAGLTRRGQEELGVTQMMKRTRTVLGAGWVSSVQQKDDGFEVRIDADEPGTKADGPEITLQVSAANMPSPQPTEGQVVRYLGDVTNYTWDMDAKRLTLSLRNGRLRTEK